jgi:hypothetical protein
LPTWNMDGNSEGGKLEAGDVVIGSKMNEPCRSMRAEKPRIIGSAWT